MNDFVCSFCGLRRREARTLVSGPGVFICDGCVDKACAQLHAEANPAGQSSGAAWFPYERDTDDGSEVRAYAVLISADRADPADGPGKVSARVPDLPGCEAVGDSPEDASRRVSAIARQRLRELEADGQPAPEVRTTVRTVHVANTSSEVKAAAEIMRAMEEARRSGERLGNSLTRLGALSDEDLTQFLSKQYHVPAINLSEFEVAPEIIALVPRACAVSHRCIPINRAGASLIVAMVDPANILAVDDLQRVTGYSVELVVVSAPGMAAALARYYPGDNENIGSTGGTDG